MTSNNNNDQNDAVFLDGSNRVVYGRQGSMPSLKRQQNFSNQQSYDSSDIELADPSRSNSPRPSIYLEVPPAYGYGRQGSITGSTDMLVDDPNQITIHLPHMQGTGLPTKLSATRAALERLRKNMGITMLVFGCLTLAIGIIVFLVRPAPKSVDVIFVSPVINGTSTTSAPTTQVQDTNNASTPVGSILMGLGCLLIFVGLSVIFGPKLKPPKPLIPRSERPFMLGRRVSTIPDTDFYQRSLSMSSMNGDESPTEPKNYNPALFTGAR